VPGDRRVDQPRVLGAQRVVIDPELRHHARPVVLDEDVRHAGEACEDGAALLVIEIEDNALFAAVDGIEGGAVVAAGAGHAARRIAGGRLDFDDARAHIRQ
jgi:hypothetical protein